MSHIKEFEHLKIQLEAINSATNNFADDNCIGGGGFGKVYKGELVLSKGQTTVALKRLDRKFGQGDPEFWKEIMMLSRYKHENIVSFLGFCDESGEKILVYDYVSKKSLDLYLDNDELTWVRRLKLCIGAASGLAYLHDSAGTHQRVLHRDIKSANILLDENWNARISDMGLSKFGPANEQYSFLFSNVVGTVGYCDPIYVETGLLTKESDVYSFGVVLFEVLCGRLCMGNNSNNRRPLIGLVRECYKQNKINDIIYDNIKAEINPNSLETFVTIAYQCLKRNREERPSMEEIVRSLESALEHQLIYIDDQQPSSSRILRPLQSFEGFTFTEVNSVCGASGVLCCHFSSDGKWLASGDVSGKVVLRYTHSFKPMTTHKDHSSMIRDVRFSPSMPCVAMPSDDKTVRVWDLDNPLTLQPGSSLRTFMGHSYSVMSLDFHPNKDDLLCSCDLSGETRYWSITNGTCARVFKVFADMPGNTQVRFQPRHGRFLAAAAENMVLILDVETQACLHTLTGHTKQINSVCWDLNGEYLASVSEDSVRVWSLMSENEGECVHNLSRNGSNFYSCVFHPFYASLLVIGGYESLELWNMSENKTMTLPAQKGLISGLAVSTVTSLVASANYDGSVKLWK